MDAENKSEESVMDFLTPLFAQFDKIYHDLAKRHGESYFGMWVLEEIGDRPEGVTQKQLCEILYSPKQTVNSLVASFVRRGLVETKPNSTDGRSKLHVLTEEGKAKLEAIRHDEKMLGSYSLNARNLFVGWSEQGRARPGAKSSVQYCRSLYSGSCVS